MQWLNKLDSVLDNVLLPRNRQNNGHDTDSIDADEYYRQEGHGDGGNDEDDPEYLEDDILLLGQSMSSLDASPSRNVFGTNDATDGERMSLTRPISVVGAPGGKNIRFPGVIRPIPRERQDDSSCDSLDDMSASMSVSVDGIALAGETNDENGNHDAHIHADDDERHENRFGNGNGPAMTMDKIQINTGTSKNDRLQRSPSNAPKEIKTLSSGDQQQLRMSPLFTPPPVLQQLPTSTASHDLPKQPTKRFESSSNHYSTTRSSSMDQSRSDSEQGNAPPAPAPRPPMHAFPTPIPSPSPSASGSPTKEAWPPPPLPSLNAPTQTPPSTRYEQDPSSYLHRPTQLLLPPPPPPPTSLLNISKESVDRHHEPLIVPDSEDVARVQGSESLAEKGETLEEVGVATTIDDHGTLTVKKELNDLILDTDADVVQVDAEISTDGLNDSITSTKEEKSKDKYLSVDNNAGDNNDNINEEGNESTTDPINQISSTMTLTQAVESASSYLPSASNMFGLIQSSSLAGTYIQSGEEGKEVQESAPAKEDHEKDEIEKSENGPEVKENHEKTDYDALEGMQATFGDFFPVHTFDEDKNEDDLSVMTSISEKEGKDYEVQQIQDSWDDDGLAPFEPWMNCHGVVYVRLLRVQHLPCSINSALQANFSLPPWKGRIRSEKVNTYQGPSKSGICARWDRKVEKDETLDEKEDNKIPCMSMVHPYNDHQSPVPVISIVLKDMALMFEREVCTLSLSCEPLMKRPGVFRRHWCRVDHVEDHSVPRISGDERIGNVGENKSFSPILLVEACFEPTDFGENEQMSKFRNSPLNQILLNDGEIQQQRQRIDTQDTIDSSGISRRGLKSKPHMFINYSSLRPTYCALCSSIIMWKLKGYQCEICKLDCCDDCRLRIDVEMPCGSDKAKDVVKELAQSKLTFAKVYEAVAPKKQESEMPSKQTTLSRLGSRGSSDEKIWTEGVGTFTLRINKACIFKNSFPPEASLNTVMEASDRRLLSGDYYARVSWTDGTKTRRTKTVFQSAKPRFDSDDIVITAMHYGVEFKIEVMDAMTDRPVGTKLLTTQGLLQWERDNIGWGLSPSAIFNPKPLQLSKEIVHMELRSGIKSGFGLDFYNTGKLTETSRAGEISGWIEVDVAFQENPDLYSNSHPRPYPPRPADDFNVELIQLHIARITSLVEDFNRMLESYLYLVSWKNPALTSLSMIIFVSTCLRFNTEYIGSLPFLLIIVFMIHSGRMRKRKGGFKVGLVKKETEQKLKEIRGASVNYKTHRPMGELEISVIKGRNLVPHHGIPGSLVSSITWDPLKFTVESFRKEIIDCDPTSAGLHHIGETEGSGVTSSPEWNVVHGSNELERMKQLLPSKNFLSRTLSSEDFGSKLTSDSTKSSQNELNFPILQPIAPVDQLNSEVDMDGKSVKILPWDKSDGAIIIQVRFADVLNKLPIFDQILGDVIIPMSTIAKTTVVEGWFQVLEKGTLRTVELSPDGNKPFIRDNDGGDKMLAKLSSQDAADDEQDPISEEVKPINSIPSVYLKIKLNVPVSPVISDIDKETSIVVAEHLIRTGRKTDHGPGFIGSSINTFNTVTGVRGNLQFIQNQLGDILDKIEIVFNTFNFMCPDKSGMILVLLCILWLILIVIPTRFVILLGGLGHYAITFFVAFRQKTSKEEEDVHKSMKINYNDDPSTVMKNLVFGDDYNPYTVRIQNFFFGIPTYEDLRRYYFWDSVQAGETEREIVARKKRSTRLGKLWKAQWFGRLELKTVSGSGHQWDWKPIFCIFQGHRFIWWSSEKDFDEGENPSGQIYFAGHSGLAGLSPLEMRELTAAEVPLVTNIFGRGSTRGGQQTKISLLSPDLRTKEGFELAAINATLDKHD